MLDLSATLVAAEPLIDGWRVFPPSPPQNPLWRTLVLLRGSGDVDFSSSLTPFLVGAYGHSRRDSVVRGFGEAIERAALIPRADGVEQALGCPRLDVSDPGVALAGEGAEDAAGSWLPARSLTGPSPRAVPAGLVDYPWGAADAQGIFDPSPSGAASGIGEPAALRAALLEVIERDAFLLAWDVGASVPRIDLARLPDPVSPSSRAARAALERLLAFVARIGATLVLADIPTAADGILCAAAVLVDPRAGAGADAGTDPRSDAGTGAGRGSAGAGARAHAGAAGRAVRGTRVAVGCNAHDDPWVAVLGAVQETLQLRSLQEDLSAEGRPVPAGEVTDEQSRLDRLASPEGVEDVLAWVDGLAPACARRYSPVTTDELVDSIAAEGGEPLSVDLTPRLPEAMRALGWSVVKVIPAGMQALRLDERNAWSWNAPRRRRVVERWSADGIALLRPDGGGPPHPLP